MDAQLRLIPRSQASTREATTRNPRRRLRSAPPATTDPTDPTTRPGDSPEPAEAPIHWRIDDSARARGRAGISQAREALGQARRPIGGDRHHTAAA
jgi:hypothetical protein